ncbi:MAG: FecR domain-containing protein [Opitutaceae bacterium]|nr:FecR domain-containing protein [Opitutaceae bacterium]
MNADAELNAIETTAADWLVRRDRGFTPAQEREFSRWLACDARHAAMFEALDTAWVLMGEGGSGAAARTIQTPRRVIPWWPTMVAAAAAIAVGFAGWSRASRNVSPRPAVEYELTAATDVGDLRKVDLPDGSVIQLNTGSAVVVRYEPHERRVRLTRGEAYFTVAKNPGRPFIVNAAGVDVRVMGTVFNVRLRADTVDVLVTEGKVSVQPPSREKVIPTAMPAVPTSWAELTAGQKLSVDLRPAAPVVAAQPVPVPAAAIRQTLAWQERRLEFDATPLAEIVMEFNRHTRHELVIADERLRAVRFGGSFPVADYETFVRMLEKDFGIVAERRERRTFLRQRSP